MASWALHFGNDLLASRESRGIGFPFRNGDRCQQGKRNAKRLRAHFARIELDGDRSEFEDTGDYLRYETAVTNDFPVFLHPQTHEEYALARTERKTARGYHGFKFHAAADVTLDQDLARRDLTINAIPKDAEGRIIDPHHGVPDLKAGVLRHVTRLARPGGGSQ